MKDVLKEMAEQSLTNTLAIIMAPHQCWISWDWYQNTVSEANDALGEKKLTVTYADPWWKEPEFIQANADNVRSALTKLGDKAAKAKLIFSAHAIPINSCEFCKSGERNCPYSVQFEESAKLIAEALGRGADYLTCYQSQAGFAAPWTSPDVKYLIADCAKEGITEIVISPIGFLVDHVEVLWDLDVDARKACEACNITYARADTVGSHPEFIKLLADRVIARFEGHERIEAPLH